MEERGRDHPAPALLGRRDPRLLQHRRLELAPLERREAVAAVRRRGAGDDGLPGHGALEHQEPGVGRAVAVVEGHELSGELLRREDTGIRPHDQGRAHDHRATSDLQRSRGTFRHPAVIAALSPLEHAGFAPVDEQALVGDRLDSVPSAEERISSGAGTAIRRSSPSASKSPSSRATSTSRPLNAITRSMVSCIARLLGSRDPGRPLAASLGPVREIRQPASARRPHHTAVGAGERPSSSRATT